MFDSFVGIVLEGVDEEAVDDRTVWHEEVYFRKQDIVYRLLLLLLLYLYNIE